jgi:flagellar protein FlgJ
MTSITVTHNTDHSQFYADFAQLGKLGHQARHNGKEALEEVAQQFEAIFLNIALKSMREANESFAKDSPFNSQESRIYRDMLDNQLSLNMTKGPGIGLAKTLVQQLSKYLPQDQRQASSSKIDLAI